MKTKTPTDGGALRDAMRVFAKKPTLALRANYKATFKKDPTGLSHDALVKALASHAGNEQPAASHPKKEEQAKPRPTGHTGLRHPLLPPSGTTIERKYRGKTYRVEVREDALRYDGKDWNSLSALAKHITGATSISGTLWWGLAKRATAPEATKPAAAKAPRAKKAKKG